MNDRTPISNASALAIAYITAINYGYVEDDQLISVLGKPAKDLAHQAWHHMNGLGEGVHVRHIWNLAIRLLLDGWSP